jgi:membrane protein YdbS with pleckstrin-like domain
VASTRESAFKLLVVSTVVMLILLIATAVVIIWQTVKAAPGWSHLALLAIFALLMGFMIWAIIKVSQPE